MIHWIKGHKFWTAIILLIVIGGIVSMFAGNAFMIGRIIGWIFVGMVLMKIASKMASKKEKREK